MPSKKQGWVTAHPLENYSSLHELSLTNWLGWSDIRFKIPIFIQIDANSNTPFSRNPQAHLIFKTVDADKPIDPNCCFSITQVKRWRKNITSYSSFDEFLGSLIRWHRCNYLKSQKTFKNYGSTVALIDGDWTEHVETVYRLYSNVAKNHGEKLYDLCFFHKIAKRSDYKLLCTLFEGKIIGVFVLQEEHSTLHSTCLGMDYDHSSRCYAYSWMHYELIRIAIESKKYQWVDVGVTADESKKEIGFEPILSRMDIYAKGFVTPKLLKLISTVVTATITSDSKVKFKQRLFRNL